MRVLLSALALVLLAGTASAQSAPPNVIEWVPVAPDQTIGVSIRFIGNTRPISWPPDPIIEATVQNPQPNLNPAVQPGVVRPLCVYYEAQRVIVNPCPEATEPDGL